MKEAIGQQQQASGPGRGGHNNGSCAATPVTSANASPLSHRAAPTEPDHLLEPPNGHPSTQVRNNLLQTYVDIVDLVDNNYYYILCR